MAWPGKRGKNLKPSKRSVLGAAISVCICLLSEIHSVKWLLAVRTSGLQSQRLTAHISARVACLCRQDARMTKHVGAVIASMREHLPIERHGVVVAATYPFFSRRHDWGKWLVDMRTGHNRPFNDAPSQQEPTT